MQSFVDAASRSVTFILAGGRGKRLHPLTRNRAKSLLPFGGVFRLIDFTLSNCINSGLDRAYLLTQYDANSVRESVTMASGSTEFVCLPSRETRLYRGTADAVAQNLRVLDSERFDHVLILSSDHVSKMDYRKLLQFHAGHGGAVTIAAFETSRRSARDLGVLTVRASSRVTGYEEKPERPQSLPGDSSKIMAGAGVYVCSVSSLRQALLQDALSQSTHDFESDVLPVLIKSHAVYACDSQIWGAGRSAYWRAIGSIDSYHAAQMELLLADPPFEPFGDRQWPMRQRKALSVQPLEAQLTAGSILCSNSKVFGAQISESVISSDVEIESSARVQSSILLRGVRVGRGARIRKAVVEEGIHIPAGMKIGFDLDLDRRRFVVSEGGVVVVHSEHRQRMVA